ncbi:hypothetical protein TNIN_207331 [Trichonephila inaurata madagascariensis]|uniref:Uncharacterized protein n=1 Tax=Trichonephila inaurata madagascariensis TaxID=2747483 RepID=A0A8X6XMN6_9ARAC|nr:hypothetical protein TNIN_207331 [Trichonephila inaurata madagascariensis]
MTRALPDQLLHTQTLAFSPADHQLQPLILYNREPPHLHLLNDDSVSSDSIFRCCKDPWGRRKEKFFRVGRPSRKQVRLFDLSLGNASFFPIQLFAFDLYLVDCCSGRD